MRLLFAVVKMFRVRDIFTPPLLPPLHICEFLSNSLNMQQPISHTHEDPSLHEYVDLHHPGGGEEGRGGVAGDTWGRQTVRQQLQCAAFEGMFGSGVRGGRVICACRPD